MEAEDSTYHTKSPSLTTVNSESSSSSNSSIERRRHDGATPQSVGRDEQRRNFRDWTVDRDLS
jgi:hypothetical protein